MALTQVPLGMLSSEAQFYDFKNRLINGQALIDQRNAGASYSIANGGAIYGLDRWFIQNDTSTAITGQQSTDAPAGFKNSIKISNTTSANPTSVQQRLLGQTIEGYNVVDIAFGTSAAQPVTLSFWVKSSTAGTYGVAIENPTGANSYVGQYTINSANTWEYKSITVPAITTGTWATGNTGGLGIYFDLGSGTGVEGTANTWNSADRKRVSSNVNLFSSANQAIYFTGLQLEKGNSATAFDYRPYGTELMLCQRYFYLSGTLFHGAITAGAQFGGTVPFPVPMRAAPSVTQPGAGIAVYGPNFADYNVSNPSVSSFSPYNFARVLFGTGTGGGAGVGTYVYGTGTLQFSAEL